jgi:4-diphosphocytidyl-2-C-methyl-D-erythritol kinase
MTKVEVAAPAKINLTLHVTGQRADGYHLLDSLVVFAGVHDHLIIGPAQKSSFTVQGPCSKGVPTDARNLVLRALEMALPGEELTVSLTKNLPASAGIGGGSADAAAALRGALALSEKPQATKRHALRLGADVPMCLTSAPCRVRGIGDLLENIQLPTLHAVLANPGTPVATPDVFARLVSRENVGMPDSLPRFPNAAPFIEWLKSQRNDLQDPAVDLVPAIADCIGSLETAAGCGLARMSGSGATCFGLFSDDQSAKSAARMIQTAHPDWWVVSTILGDQSGLAKPQIS